MKATGTPTREKIFLRYDIENYKAASELASEKLTPLNKAIEELEAILKNDIEDYKAFSKDILTYSVEAIKKAYPKPFQLDLDLETTFKMLSIDLTNLKNYARTFDTSTEFTITNSYARNKIKSENFNRYVETPEQFDRYDLSMQIIDTIKKAISYSPALTLPFMASRFRKFIECNYDIKGEIKISVRADFVLSGN